MKVLFYLEPHPIRERYESFGWVGREMAQMLQDQYVHTQFNKKKQFLNMKILVSRHYNGLVKEFPKIKSAFIGLTEVENNALSYFYDDWNEKSIAVWKDLMEGKGEVSSFYQKILTRIKRNVFDFDVIVYWSTNGAVKLFAQDEKIISIAMELGCTRTPFFESTYMDFAGVNGNAITRQIDLDFVEPCDLDELRSLLPYALENGKEEDGRYNVLRSRYNDELYENPSKNILIPMQLDDDSNVLMFSKYNNLLEFLKEILPPLVDAGYRCFIKPHPGAKSRKLTERGHSACEDYCCGFEQNVFWLDDVVNKKDYLSLLQKMHAVVTINSSVGFEAMILDKVVVCCGDGAYSFDSLPTFAEFLENGINEAEYKILLRKIVNVMINNYLLPKDYMFEQNFFNDYLFQRIRWYKAYTKFDNKAFTEFFINEKNNIENYFLLYDSDQSFLSQYKNHPKATTTTTPHKVVQPANDMPNKLEQQHRRNRKLRKLMHSPRLFFIDAAKKFLKS